jgi:inosose dehydratase
VKVAANPLGHYATPDGRIDRTAGPPEEEVLRDVARAGFAAVQARLREYRAPHEEARRWAACGLAPAPAYLELAPAAPDPSPEDLARLDAAVAASRAWGLTDLVIAAPLDEARRRRPAAGRAPDEAALAATAAALAALGARARRGGVRLCLHPHVGTTLEGPAEVEALLDRTEPAHLALCADTGHLAWGGVADVAGFLERHRARVGMLHLKDLSRPVQARARASGWWYERCVAEGIWREPGDGDLELARVVAAWRDTDAWCVVEVDAPARATPFESLRASAAFLRRHGAL